MKPSELYQQRKHELSLQDDTIQDATVQLYDQLQNNLSNESDTSSFFSRKKNRREDIPGMYIWGGVGRGKTMLMDLFYDTLAQEDKLRMHFHRFMSMVHEELGKLQGQDDTLVKVARKLARKTRVLCLDEFHVNDIGDAMILGILMQELFKRKVLLITTSNRPPDDLYKNGLQRARFLPAIAALKAHCQVIELDNQTDYRLLTLQREHTYHTPLGDKADADMLHAFKALTSNESCSAGVIQVNGREIAHKGEAEGVIWFEFTELCESARSQEDYLEIAVEHHSVLLSNVPKMGNENNDAARRMLNLLDVFYDQKVKLIISADTPIEKLYQGKRLAFEFDRATSRLLEMQSEEYLALGHVTSM